jgi:predicted TIM-barrel fold metal-dependent hydrolase
MQIVDAHHHLWDLDALHYPWLASGGGEAMFGDYSSLCRNYLVGDYLSDTISFEVVASVHVQAEHDESDPAAESLWLQQVADGNPTGLPSAIVAFADFSAPDVEVLLARQAEVPNVRGIRQILTHHQDARLSHAPRNYLDDPGWRRNLGHLASFDLSFDMQLFPHQMAQGASLARENTDILFIVNHAVTPVGRDVAGRLAWEKGMRGLAACENVVTKISGLGMFDPTWSTDTLRPYILETIEIFGTSRCMFGSNFPVDRLFSSFDRLYGAYFEITAGFSDDEKAMLFADNAKRFYRLGNS